MKDFKVAQIVPASCLQYIRDNHYHMCLAHLVHEEMALPEAERVYTNFYAKKSAEGKFVLMDNGAAENAQLGVAVLLETYKAVNPTEIVVPDTLCDAIDTLWKMDKFVHNFKDTLPYRFMGVPQGNDLEEWKQCATTMLERFPQVQTIGISKFLNIATGDPMVRMAAAQHVQKVALANGRTDIEIHLLGCDEGPGIVRAIRRAVPLVRGCDSAFAYIASLSGTIIGPETKRPVGEIDFLHGPITESLSSRLYEMEAACGAIYNTSSEHWR